MALNHSALLDEIQSGPLAATLAPLVQAGDDAGVAKALMDPQFDGYILPVPLLKLLTEAGTVALLDLIREHGLLPSANPSLPPSTPAPTGLMVLAYRLTRVFDHGLRMSKADAVAGCDVLVASQLMTTDVRDAVLALEVKIGRAQVLWYYDAVVTGNDVARAFGRS